MPNSNVTPQDPVEDQPAIGLIGMGGMGNMYANTKKAVMFVMWNIIKRYNIAFELR